MRVLALFLLASAALTACSRPPEGRTVSPATLARALGSVPLAQQLAHYDRAIEALRTTERRWQSKARQAEIARDRAALDSDFAAASAHLQTVARNLPAYERRDRAASDALLRLPVPHGANDPRRDASRAVARLQTGFAQRIEDAVDLRDRQLQENVSALAMAQTRRDAHQIMMLRVRLQVLGLDRARYHASLAQLDAVYATQDAERAALQARNRRILEAYRAEVTAQAAARESRAIAQVDSGESAVAAQSTAPAGDGIARIRDQARALQSSLSGSASDVAASLTAFAQARADLAARFAALAAMDEASARSARAQVVALQRERAALASETVAWIRSCAATQPARRPQFECATRSVRR